MPNTNPKLLASTTIGGHTIKMELAGSNGIRITRTKRGKLVGDYSITSWADAKQAFRSYTDAATSELTCRAIDRATHALANLDKEPARTYAKTGGRSEAL